SVRSIFLLPDLGSLPEPSRTSAHLECTAKAHDCRFTAPNSWDISFEMELFEFEGGVEGGMIETRLYIAETGNQTAPSPRQYIRVFNVGPDGATLSGGDIFHKIEPGYCDGMRVDDDGRIWSSRADGVLCISAGG